MATRSSISEVLKAFEKPTYYERDHDITVLIPWKLVQDCEDTKFYMRTKSDGSVSLLIVLRSGKTQNWFGWLPTEIQVKAILSELPRLYRKVDGHNRKAQNF